MNEINTRIISSLREIEGEKGVKILYACESGSRAWGFPSADSDYDVRFVYVQPVKRYLSIRKRRDVIEVSADGKLDISGWDLQKALLLLRKSNPPLSLKLVLTENMARGNYREYLKGNTAKLTFFNYIEAIETNELPIFPSQIGPF